MTSKSRHIMVFTSRIRLWNRRTKTLSVGFSGHQTGTRWPERTLPAQTCWTEIRAILSWWIQMEISPDAVNVIPINACWPDAILSSVMSVTSWWSTGVTDAPRRWFAVDEVITGDLRRCWISQSVPRIPGTHKFGRNTRSTFVDIVHLKLFLLSISFPLILRTSPTTFLHVFQGPDSWKNVCWILYEKKRANRWVGNQRCALKIHNLAGI